MLDRFIPSRSSPLASISSSKSLCQPKCCVSRVDTHQSRNESKWEGGRCSQNTSYNPEKNNTVAKLNSDADKVRTEQTSESVIPINTTCKHKDFPNDSLLASSIRPPSDEDELEMLNDNLPFNLFDTLQKCLFSGNAPKSFYTSIIANMKLITHVPETYILKYGEESKAFYILLKGTVAVTSQDGEAIHAELHPGAYFGEIGVIFCRTRTATVISKTKTLSIMITQNVLNSILSKFPQIERTIRDEAQKRLSLQDNKRQKRFSYEILGKNSRKLLNASSGDREQRMSIILPNIQKNHDNSVRIINQFNTEVNGFDDSYFSKSTSYSTDNQNKILSTTSDCSFKTKQISTVLAEESISDLFIPVKRFSSKLNLNNTVPFNVLYDFVLNYTKINYFNQNELIFRKNDNSKDVYFILDGEVKILDAVEIYLKSSELHGTKFEKVLAHLKKFDYFGEMAFINRDCTVRTADVIALNKVKLLVFPYENLKDLCEKYPSIFDGFQSEATRRKNANDEIKLAENHHNEINYSMIKEDAQYEMAFQRIDSSISQTISSATGGIKWNSNFLSESIFGNHAATRSSTFKELYSSTGDSAGSPLKRRSSISKMFCDIDSTVSSGMIKNIASNNLEIKKRRRSAFETPSYQANFADSSSLCLPPLNPPEISPNLFKGQQFQSKFQYLNLNKRLRIQKIGGSRRRSSLLAYRPVIPDNILLRVFNMLDMKTLMVARRVCKRWRQILYLSPNLMKSIDLSIYSTKISDEILISIADFVGNRVETIDISNCINVTDKGFSYLINEIGINGNLKKLKMKSLWHVSAMSIMDVASISVGSHLEEIDLSNCKRVRDDVVQRLIGMETENNAYGSMNLARLNLSYCKYITDRTMFNLATNISTRLQYLNLQRCTTITDKGFSYWLNNSATIPNLTELVLADCTYLTSYSISAIAKSCPNLQKLDLSFCCALDETSIDILNTGCSNLQVLNLSFCGNAVSDNSLLSISLMLSRLQKLFLTGCIKVTRAGVDILLSGCCPLKYLNISQCRFAHVYPGGIEAVELPVREGSRSSFITTSVKKGVVEIVI